MSVIKYPTSARNIIKAIKGNMVSVTNAVLHYKGEDKSESITQMCIRDRGFMPLVMILLLALITSLGLKEMEIFKLILMIQIQE